jgi:raffinose/stachyose/melibiose transport system substrate-binding protein
MKPELQPYVRIMSFPDIPNQKGKSQSTTTVVSSGFGMRADLDKTKAAAAWKWIWFYSGPEGSKITQKNGGLTAYKLKPLSDTPEITKRYASFLSEKPGGYVIDSIMKGEGMGVLQPSIQQMMLGKNRYHNSRYNHW